MKRVFISFKIEDRPQVNGLRLLAANPKIEDLEFYDESVRAAYNSTDAEYIKRNIREKLKRSSVTVCIVNTATHTSQWVNWELEESIKQGNKIILMAVKGLERATLPAAVRDKGYPFVKWDIDHLAKLINED